MTQLFDTTNYAETPTGDASPVDGPLRRHLRSVPANDVPAVESTQWRLDDQTIEIGRKGIQAARQALQDAAREVDTKRERTAA